MSKDFTKDILKAQNGDKDILQKIVQENQGLIWGIVKRFSGRGYEVDDLYKLVQLVLLKQLKDLTLILRYSFLHMLYHI